jgi:hypothetical protein
VPEDHGRAAVARGWTGKIRHFRSSERLWKAGVVKRAAIDLRTLDRHHDAAVTSLIPSLSCRSCRPNARSPSSCGCQRPASRMKCGKTTVSGVYELLRPYNIRTFRIRSPLRWPASALRLGSPLGRISTIAPSRPRGQIETNVAYSTGRGFCEGMGANPPPPFFWRGNHLRRPPWVM